MTTFNLEDAKRGVPIRTRDGRKAVFIAHLQGGQPAPIVMDIWRKGRTSWGDVKDIPIPGGVMENYFPDGRFQGVHDHELDLFMDVM